MIGKADLIPIAGPRMVSELILSVPATNSVELNRRVPGTSRGLPSNRNR